jgi:hypothetical protein
MRDLERDGDKRKAWRERRKGIHLEKASPTPSPYQKTRNLEAINQ